MGKDSICYYMYNIFTKKARFLLTKSLKKSINIPIGGVAQLVERWNHNPCVGGSIPSSATKFFSHPFEQSKGFFMEKDKNTQEMTYKAELNH